MSALRYSVPGQHPRLVAEADPELALTPRQRQYLVALRSVNWNRSRAAPHQLGVRVQSVQVTLRLIAAKGVRIPPGVVGRYRRPDLEPRRRRAA